MNLFNPLKHGLGVALRLLGRALLLHIGMGFPLIKIVVKQWLMRLYKPKL